MLSSDSRKRDRTDAEYNLTQNDQKGFLKPNEFRKLDFEISQPRHALFHEIHRLSRFSYNSCFETIVVKILVAVKQKIEMMKVPYGR